MQANRLSVFTPAMNAFGGLGSLSLPPVASWAVVAALAYLGIAKKVPLWVGLGGAAAAWFFLIGGTTSTLITGTAAMITPDGNQVTLPTGVAALVASAGGAQAVVYQGVSYPLLSQQPDGSGGQTYFVDNPSAA